MGKNHLNATLHLASPGVVAITWWLAVEPARQQSDETLEQWVIRTRIEQGLPPHVEDIETLRNMIALLGLGNHQTEGGGTQQ
jgi:hypothetical protein